MRKWKPATLCWKFSHISFFLWLLSHVLVTLSILNKYGVIRWLTFWFTLSLKGDFWKRWEKLSLLGFVNFSLFSHMALSGTIWAFLLNFHISKYGTLFPKSWDIVPCIVKKKTYDCVKQGRCLKVTRENRICCCRILFKSLSEYIYIFKNYM